MDYGSLYVKFIDATILWARLQLAILREYLRNEQGLIQKMLEGYFIIGLAVGVILTLFTWYQSKRKFKGNSKKAIEKRKKYMSGSLISAIMAVFIWPFFLLIMWWDAKLKKDGMAFGMGGGGYIYAKRSWYQYFRDEFHGREGEHATYDENWDKR